MGLPIGPQSNLSHILLHIISEILQLLYAESHIFLHPNPILVKISGVPFAVDP